MYLFKIVIFTLMGFLISSDELIPAPFAKQKVIATIKDKRLVEASGLEESYQNPGYFWTHNDSGGRPMLYLINRDGEIKMEVLLKGVENRDWEEIVSLKRGNESFVYIAEIGDNKGVHESVSIICIEEPKFTGESKQEIAQNNLRIMNFRYAEGARDAEALFFDYQFDEFVLVTKRERRSMVYSFPFEPGKENVIIKSSGSIPDRNFTAADMNENGEILLKHYDSIYFWESSDTRAIDRILEWNPVMVEYSAEPQGEAVCWYQDDFYTISEKNKGKPQEMLFFKRLD
ncbi:MAG: hypothetical protein AAF391_12195 [Bacteroidota bacterium]